MLTKDVKLNKTQADALNKAAPFEPNVQKSSTYDCRTSIPRAAAYLGFEFVPDFLK